MVPSPLNSAGFELWSAFNLAYLSLTYIEQMLLPVEDICIREGNKGILGFRGNFAFRNRDYKFYNQIYSGKN